MTDETAPRRTRLYGAIDPPTLTDTAPHVQVPDPRVGEQIGRYAITEVLGRGGMGEVVSARDDQIGRNVAIKRLCIADPPEDLVARFMREAQIQGRLEHPAVVPVHELYQGAGGQPYFVMKQLAGTTLAEILAAPEQPNTQRLLRAFADVCLAIEFAHTRGVIHRDLKPANIVLGDFGEVYVLDWGVAKIAEIEERASFADISTLDGSETIAGAILGTPGYISPEQVRGDLTLDARADVYALGCILFELLAQQPLHPRGQAALSMALAGVDARASLRAPDRDIPPELDAICMRATALEPADRFQTARELGDAVQRFLDGNRDLSLRKQLAAAELALAHEALSRGEPARQEVMRAAARALALDPTSREPAEMIGALLLELPKETPPEVEKELSVLDEYALKTSARFGTLAAVAYLLFFPMLYWIGFRELWYLVAGPAISVVIILVELLVAPRNAMISGYIAIAGNLAMFALFSTMVSPAILGPGPPIIMITLLVVHRQLIKPWLLAGLTLLAVLAPWIWQYAHGTEAVSAVGTSIVLHTEATTLDPFATVIGLVVYAIALAALATMLSLSQHDEQREVRRSLQLQSWLLRQLMPRSA